MEPWSLTPWKPTKIVCVGLNYRRHAAELGMKIPDEPMLFLKPPSALIGSGEAVVIPEGVGQVDYEGELAVVIGRRARKVGFGEALDYVYGYTCANDVTARELQKRDEQWTRAKSFDTFCPVGPRVVREILPFSLRIRTLVNGVPKQSSNTADMVFDVGQLVSYISCIMTLEPGDMILTGTPYGVGPLRPGDTVEVEIEGIGRLVNPVIGE